MPSKPNWNDFQSQILNLIKTIRWTDMQGFRHASIWGEATGGSVPATPWKKTWDLGNKEFNPRDWIKNPECQQCYNQRAVNIGWSKRTGGLENEDFRKQRMELMYERKCVSNYCDPWTVALVPGILRFRILEWVAISVSCECIVIISDRMAGTLEHLEKSTGIWKTRWMEKQGSH